MISKGSCDNEDWSNVVLLTILQYYFFFTVCKSISIKDFIIWANLSF